MSTFGLTVYVLIWPVLATLVLITLCTALVFDIRKAKKDGETLVQEVLAGSVFALQPVRQIDYYAIRKPAHQIGGAGFLLFVWG